MRTPESITMRVKVRGVWKLRFLLALCRITHARVHVTITEADLNV